MNYTVENDFIKLTVSDNGAEMQSIVLKNDNNREALWQANRDGYWTRRAPILFPHCGKLVNDSFTHNGKEYHSTAHGFLRDMTFALANQTDTELCFTVASNEETKKRYPFDFTAEISYRLCGEKIHYGFKVTNNGGEDMYFNMGYHPAFNCPFDDKHTAEDYAFVFEKEESPLDICHSMTTGYNTGERKLLFENSHVWKITQDMFQNDSMAMDNLKSKYIRIQENDTGRYVQVDIAEFPFVLVWSCLKTPIKFICIEPWHGINAMADATPPLAEKYAVKKLAPGESFTADMPISFGTEK